jgi:hypothetical protein
LLEQTERVLKKSQSISWNKVPIWLPVEIIQPKSICKPVSILSIPQNNLMHADHWKMLHLLQKQHQPPLIQQPLCRHGMKVYLQDTMSLEPNTVTHLLLCLTKILLRQLKLGLILSLLLQRWNMQ